MKNILLALELRKISYSKSGLYKIFVEFLDLAAILSVLSALPPPVPPTTSLLLASSVFGANTLDDPVFVNIGLSRITKSLGNFYKLV